jgi:fumarate reductase subunit D
VAFSSLDSERIVETLERLSLRAGERFPTASINRVIAELIDLAKRDRRRSQRLARPYLLLRSGTLLAVLLAIAGLIFIIKAMMGWVDVGDAQADVFTVFEGVEAGLNIVILTAVAIFTLTRVEERLKRSLALDDLHELRSIAHVIDMHQLTKDPNALLRLGPRTSSSPGREMSEFELSRYLDYCAEALSLAGKIAALYAQSSRDPVVIAAVNDIESLTSNMSAKIWQKIMIVRGSLDRSAEQAG